MADAVAGTCRGKGAGGGAGPAEDLRAQYARACESDSPAVIAGFFEALLAARRTAGTGAAAIGVTREDLAALCARHERCDEHGVTVGGRVGRARAIARP